MPFLKKPITRIATWSLTFSLIAQGPLLCAEQRVPERSVDGTPDPESIMQDVKLTAEGVLTARIVDVQGNPVAGEHVSLMFGGKEIAAVVSDQDGFDCLCSASGTACHCDSDWHHRMSVVER